MPMSGKLPEGASDEAKEALRRRWREFKERTGLCPSHMERLNPDLTCETCFQELLEAFCERMVEAMTPEQRAEMEQQAAEQASELDAELLLGQARPEPAAEPAIDDATEASLRRMLEGIEAPDGRRAPEEGA